MRYATAFPPFRSADFPPATKALGYYDSSAVEMVGGIFSILAAVNFTLYFVAVGRRSLKPLYRSPELRFFLLILAIVVAIVCIELYRSGMYGVKDAFVHGFFLTSSMMTDNGSRLPITPDPVPYHHAAAGGEFLRRLRRLHLRRH